MTITDQRAREAGLTRMEYIDQNLDNPEDPFGLADKPEYILKYFAPKLCGEIDRAELCRRYRVNKAKEQEQ